MITIVDYGMGNLRSVTNAFEAIGQSVVVTREPSALYRASAIILPGVGAFGDGMKNLTEQGFLEPLHEAVFERRTPFLGICLGMQFLAEESLEHGRHRGLGWVRAVVKRITPTDPAYKVPHMGWNDVQIERPSDLFTGLIEPLVCYFVHSYHLEVAPEEVTAVTSTCWHGMSIVASVQKGHIYGVQFHPEKSQRDGVEILKNFVRVVELSAASRANRSAAACLKNG